MSERILIIEDDQRLANLIQDYLIRQGYQIEWHNSGDTAEEKIRQVNPDLLILDVMLPGKSGFDICRDVRAWFNNFILIMTASEDDIDEIVGLELGADDYLAKPVEPRLLLARIRALFRRKQTELEKGHNLEQAPIVELNLNVLIFNDLLINIENRKVLLQEQEIDLTTAEFDLLWLLASNAGKILSRDDIFSQVRGIDFDGSDRSIDARISRLRRKLFDDPDNPSCIKTVRGKGYLFLRSGEDY